MNSFTSYAAGPGVVDRPWLLRRERMLSLPVPSPPDRRLPENAADAKELPVRQGWGFLAGEPELTSFLHTRCRLFPSKSKDVIGNKGLCQSAEESTRVGWVMLNISPLGLKGD